MAAAQQQNTAARGSSVLDFTQGVRAVAISQSPWRTLRRVMFVAADLADPKHLYDVLYKVQDLIFQGVSPLVLNGLLSGNRLRNVTFTSGQTQVLPHGLGRAWQGFFITNASVGVTPAFQVAALPAGLMASQVISLTASNAGIYDFYVF